MKLTLVATCMFGLEKLLGEEIDALGCKRIETIDGRITFEGTPEELAENQVVRDKYLTNSFKLRKKDFQLLGQQREQAAAEQAVKI